MQNRMTGNEYRTTLLCVDSFEERQLRWRLYNPLLCGGQRFDSLMQMLLQMEQLLDDMKFPQPFEAKKEFAPVARISAAPREEGELRGERATISLRILFRQNASWQGSVTWLETGQEESFRSVLELLFLMNSALGTAEAQSTA